MTDKSTADHIECHKEFLTGNRRPTSFDIAQLAGVSQPTVSRALRNSPLVSEGTRQKIQQIAKELNYAVDKNASSLRSQQSHTLALLFFEDGAKEEGHINPFYLTMLGAITRHAANNGYDLLISFQQLSGDWHKEYQFSHKADGIILLGYGDYQLYRSRLEHLAAQKTCFVRWGAVRPDEPGVTLGSDNRGGGYAATRHLINCGRENIAFLGTASDHAPEFQHRWLGYVDALRGAGRMENPALQRNAENSQEAGQKAMEALLAAGQKCDAVFAASDMIAIGAMRAARAEGLDIPHDIAFVGFDDIPAASLTSPPLTTVAQDIKGAGRELVDALLVKFMASHPKKQHCLQN